MAAGARVVRGSLRNKAPTWFGQKWMRNMILSQIKDSLRAAGVIPALASLLHTSRTSVKDEALGALVEFVREDDSYVKEVYDALWPTTLIEALQSASPRSHYYGLSLIWIFLNHIPSSRAAFQQAEALEFVKRLGTSTNREVVTLAPRVTAVFNSGNIDRETWRLAAYSFPR